MCWSQARVRMTMAFFPPFISLVFNLINTKSSTNREKKRHSSTQGFSLANLRSRSPLSLPRLSSFPGTRPTVSNLSSEGLTFNLLGHWKKKHLHIYTTEYIYLYFSLFVSLNENVWILKGSSMLLQVIFISVWKPINVYTKWCVFSPPQTRKAFPKVSCESSNYICQIKCKFFLFVYLRLKCIFINTQIYYLYLPECRQIISPRVCVCAPSYATIS